MKKTVIELDEWRAALEEAAAQQADVVPPDWVSITVLSEGLGCTDTHARKQIAALISQGKAERKKYRVLNSSGVARRTYHYKLKK